MLHNRISLTAIALTVSILSISQCLYAQHRTPTPLPSYKVNEYPFNVVGQVSSPLGRGSGTAISQKVILSCAHVFFNENTLDWSTGPFQWNLLHSPFDQSFDMTARSYQYFSDYAEATRRFDPGGGKSSWEQFNLDAIALIFYEDVANGGYAGWGRNQITNSSDKMIVGYPDLNYSSYDPRGQTMHSTSFSGSRARFSLAHYHDKLGSIKRVYTTSDLSTGPGSSGGPVYGQMTFSDGTVDWGVVGIVLGGTIGENSVAVGIDSGVSNLITAAISDSGVTTPSDDHGDTRNTATKIGLNRSVSGNLETRWDIDYFRFLLRDEGTVTISTTGRINTFGELENNSGNYIAANDDSGSGKNFLITRELDPGTYYISVGASFYEEAGNYTLRVDFTETIKLPDLVVDSVDVDSKSVVAGETVRVDFYRSNTGDKDSGLFAHGLYLSADEIITIGDIQLVDFADASLSAGASEGYFFEVTIPTDTTPGIYSLGYIIDSDKQIEESDETNNTGYATITVEAPASDDDYGDTFGSATTVELNRPFSGNIEAEDDDDYFRFVLTRYGTITAFTTGDTDTIGALGVDSETFIIAADDDGGSGGNFLITRKLDPGTYYIVVGSPGPGPYTLRVNFSESVKLTGPDLTVDFVLADRWSVATGEMISVDFNRSNTGDKTSGEFTDGFYLSTDKVITTGDTLLVDDTTVSMRAGVSERFYAEITIPPNTIPGIYYIGYILDSFMQVEESDETNNTGFATITVEAPISDDDHGDLVLGGLGDIAGEDIQHPSGNFFDQVLLTGPYIKLKAEPSQITRVSFMDEDEDIVQVEFSGAGTFTVTLEPATFMPPAIPPRYNQVVEYVTGKPSVVIDGADSNTFFSIFTVGKINAVNQALFPEGQVYDAQADVTLVEVINSTGMGGMQLSNTVFSGNTGKVGVDARGVPIAVRLTIGDIDASGDAVPYLLFGESSFTVPAGNTGLRVTGGDLKQTNSASIVVAESGSTTPRFETLISQNNFKSDETPQPAQSIDATFINEDGVVIPVTVDYF